MWSIGDFEFPPSPTTARDDPRYRKRLAPTPSADEDPPPPPLAARVTEAKLRTARRPPKAAPPAGKD